MGEVERDLAQLTFVPYLPLSHLYAVVVAHRFATRLERDAIILQRSCSACGPWAGTPHTPRVEGHTHVEL
jgi:hypothetical protein